MAFCLTVGLIQQPRFGDFGHSVGLQKVEVFLNMMVCRLATSSQRLKGFSTFIFMAKV
jgi:hypothetical protein